MLREEAGLQPTPNPCPNCLLVPDLFASAPPTCLLRSASQVPARAEGKETCVSWSDGT